MGDTIQLLPDALANQIAAGEVIQRPASAVKELLENAVDAGATDIQLILVDAGKALIQVVDNGKGMSPMDARLCFERHATSKIKQLDDLFQIKTMGFRGEALASIAAVAQVELKTRRAEDELGTEILIEDSKVLHQEPCATPIGTNFMMKNLFFSVPARRNFLKSNTAEMKHVLDEFIRVALAFPQIHFSLTHNNQQVYFLEKGNRKQRIVQLLGQGYNSKLVPVTEHTDYLNINGFIGKPETARKTRGDQYFFVNNRFIKSAYLHHAVMQAYQDLIPADHFPSYVLYLELDPAHVDINVHPTKQEIKFDDDKIIYAFVQAAAKHALAQFSVAPPLEFDLDAGIQQLTAIQRPATDQQQMETKGSALYQSFTQKGVAHKIEPSSIGSWKQFFSAAPSSTADKDTIGKMGTDIAEQLFSASSHRPATVGDHAVFQIQQTYIVLQQTSGFWLVHQQLAHERILYERLGQALQGKSMSSQRSLFPTTLQLNGADSLLLEEMITDLAQIGFIIEKQNHQFIIQGKPADVLEGNESRAIEAILEQFKHFNPELKLSSREKLLRSAARQQSIKAGRILSVSEMQQIIHDLIQCESPNLTPGGAPTYIEFDGEYLAKLFFTR